LRNFILNLKKNSPVPEQPFFVDLKNGTMSKKKFKETQICFLGAVLFFSRPMLVLASRLESYIDRNIVLKNIFDEHGNGQLERAHGNTFRTYLLSLGVKDDKIRNQKPFGPAMAFNETLMHTATHRPKTLGIGMIGMIEYRYAEISEYLIRQVLEKRWINKNNLAHYLLHEELDTEHAEGFFKIIESSWNNPDQKKQIKKGLTLGNDLIINLYNNLL